MTIAHILINIIMLANGTSWSKDIIFSPVFADGPDWLIIQDESNSAQLKVGSWWTVLTDRGPAVLKLSTTTIVEDGGIEYQSTAFLFKRDSSEPASIPIIAIGPWHNAGEAASPTLIEPRELTAAERNTLLDSISSDWQTSRSTTTQPRMVDMITASSQSVSSNNWNIKVGFTGHFPFGILVDYIVSDHRGVSACLRVFLASQRQFGRCLEHWEGYMPDPTELKYFASDIDGDNRIELISHSINEPWQYKSGPGFGPSRSIIQLRRNLRLKSIMSSLWDRRCASCD